MFGREKTGTKSKLPVRNIGWFTRATQTQTQMQAQAQANISVNYHNANASASANARNGKFFISLRLHLRLRLHFTRVNRGNANAKANARWTTLVPCFCGLISNQDGVLMRWKTIRECQKISRALRKKVAADSKKKNKKQLARSDVAREVGLQNGIPLHLAPSP